MRIHKISLKSIKISKEQRNKFIHINQIKKSRFSVNSNFRLFKISTIFFVKQHKINPVLDAESVMNVFVRWRKLDAVHIHSDWNNFASVWASIHDFILD
jgi:hypothetical protein